MKNISIFTIAFMVSLSSYSQTILKADGPDNTYELIASVLAPGYNPIETPDCSHPDFGRHITEIWDNQLDEYVFDFFIHVTPDNDRCINFDRQRNEIKVYDKSPDSLRGFYGSCFVFKWKFKLDSLFQPSTSFTHIHQLKAVGGNETSMPLITLSPRKSSPDKLQLLYASSDKQEEIAKINLSLVRGVWVEVTETVTFGEHGAYEILIEKTNDRTELFHYKNNDIRMWRTNTSFVRPKWGIYRSLNHQDQLRDEQVLFADFSIDLQETIDVPELANQEKYILYPNPTNGLVNIILKRNGQSTNMRIFDEMGKIVVNKNIINNTKVNLSGLSSGLYFFVFDNINAHQTIKIWKR